MKEIKIPEKNILKMRPDIAKQWFYTKNNPIRPEYVGIGSKDKYWWKCSKGHKCMATVAARIYNGTGCPVCANRIILEGYNDLASKKPEIVEWWNFEKNKEILPTQISSYSNKIVWWKCPKGHEFKARINDRVRKGYGCPVCSNRLIIPGINDLKTLRPDLAAEWDYWQNDIKPTEVSIGSNKKVWWVCARGHRWQANINDRKRGNGCAICSRKLKKRNKIMIKNDLI